MIKNIFLYMAVLLSAFVFNIFFYAWFSWYLLVLVLCIPIFSLVCSLPFMIINAVKGFSISTQKELTVGDEIRIGIACRNGKGLFCPMMKIVFKTSNDFAGQKKRLKFLYGGFLKNPVYKKSKELTRNCGCLRINAKYCKVYDLLGIFFIPVKLNCHTEVLIMPRTEKPSELPNSSKMKIIGYKPKTGGFAEEYELRNYHRGDSLKNIHWKISARHNELIVKEPSVPVYRPLVLKPVITRNSVENNVTLGKFLYSANFLIKNKKVFYCISPDNKICEINSEEDIKNFLLYLYKKQAVAQVKLGTDNVVTYTITHNGEVVSV